MRVSYHVRMKLNGRVALVTGGASGMGQSGAYGLAAEGAKIVIADINAAAGEKTVARIKADGGQALFVQTDLTKAADCEQMVAQGERAFGKIDVAFVNAAVQLHGRDTVAHELDEAVWDKTVAINMKGMWLSCKYALQAMLRAGGGSLILTGSPTGLNGAAGYTAYATTKAGSYALARTIAQDYAKHHIRANVLVPGPMRTPLTADLFADDTFRTDIENVTMMKRLGEAHEIVGLLVFLASDEASYCTGGYFMADGGMTAL
jgi:NAD(P)-dependent dehydrogenase (short-subunit alcohol dehydrogenase family)